MVFDPRLVPQGESGARLPATRFVTSAARVDRLPEHEYPEFAVIGRSNVGKSSLLNAVLKRAKMVRTSRTPGRTQLLNLFLFENAIALVDLPGYGYAQMSKADRASMQRMITEYLAERPRLYGVMQLFDARRDEPTEDDLHVADWVMQHHRQLLVVLTKTDLVPKNQLKARARAFEKALGVPQDAALLFSSKTNAGRDELVARLRELR
jgi:GTP-binding protein